MRNRRTREFIRRNRDRAEELEALQAVRCLASLDGEARKAIAELIDLDRITRRIEILIRRIWHSEAAQAAARKRLEAQCQI